MEYKEKYTCKYCDVSYVNKTKWENCEIMCKQDGRILWEDRKPLYFVDKSINLKDEEDNPDFVYSFAYRERTVLEEGVYKDYHYVITSMGSHPCAYVECKNEDFGYEDYEENIRVHGDVTFCSILEETYEQYNKAFIGWGYAHAFDYTKHHFTNPFTKDKKHTLKEIREEVYNCVEQMIKFENVEAR